MCFCSSWEHKLKGKHLFIVKTVYVHNQRTISKCDGSNGSTYANDRHAYTGVVKLGGGFSSSEWDVILSWLYTGCVYLSAHDLLLRPHPRPALYTRIENRDSKIENPVNSTRIWVLSGVPSFCSLEFGEIRLLGSYLTVIAVHRLVQICGD